MQLGPVFHATGERAESSRCAPRWKAHGSEASRPLGIGEHGDGTPSVASLVAGDLIGATKNAVRCTW
jgi:hypothetical protein